MHTPKFEKVVKPNIYDNYFTCMLGNFSCFCCRLQLSFFKINFQECQTVWNQTRHDILSDLIWVQTVCKSYQHTGTCIMFKKSPLDEKVVTRGKRVNEL